MNRLSKNTKRALTNAKTVDEVIEQFAQPNTHKYRGNNDYIQNTLRNNKPVFSEYYGMYKPVKLNISADTLSKLKQCK